MKLPPSVPLLDLTLPLGRYISRPRKDHSLCFCGNWMRWAELRWCPSHLLPQQGAVRGVWVVGGWWLGERRARNGSLSLSLWLARTLIRRRRRRRRLLSPYSRNRQHQRGSVWHTGKVITTAALSLGRTNGCFTWLNGDVQRRDRNKVWEGALSSKGRWKQAGNSSD